MAQAADLAEDERIGRQSERRARFGAQKCVRNIVAVDDHRHVVAAIGLDHAMRATDHVPVQAEPMDDLVQRHQRGCHEGAWAVIGGDAIARAGHAARHANQQIRIRL